jgi:hypothetical protein
VADTKKKKTPVRLLGGLDKDGHQLLGGWDDDPYTPPSKAQADNIKKGKKTSVMPKVAKAEKDDAKKKTKVTSKGSVTKQMKPL